MTAVQAYVPHFGRHPRRPGLLIGGACLLLSLLGSACSSHSGPTIVLYNGQHPQTTDALVSAFEQATGINVVVSNGDEDQLGEQIETEGANSPADVFYTENSQILEALQQKHLLAGVDGATLAETPARFDSPQGDWVGVSARVSVLIYNPSLISASELPTAVLDMADSKYRGKIAIADAETDFEPVVTSVLRTYGQARTLQWLQGLKANAAGHIYADNETIADEVNRGEVAFGIINQYYWYRLRAQDGNSGMHSQIAYFAARDPGYVLDVSGAGVLASSRHQALAQRFLAFLVSKAGQEIIAHSTSFEYPIASGVSTAQPETPFDKLQPNSITVAELGSGLQAFDLLHQVQLI
ncbi:MAG TPA: extracellular solute-binding protein [Acidimicrobiales bacterium]|nr:extracellular solute-binding protein [Acidimicrobiales bacterium]